MAKWLVKHPKYKPATLVHEYRDKKGHEKVIAKFSNLPDGEYRGKLLIQEIEFFRSDVKIIRVKSKIEKFFIRLFRK